MERKKFRIKGKEGMKERIEQNMKDGRNWEISERKEEGPKQKINT
jgi:hypothetical protein